MILIALLATSRQRRLCNTALTREIRIDVLRRELDRRQASGFLQATDRRIVSLQDDLH
jgi:hypothetical protein